MTNVKHNLRALMLAASATVLATTSFASAAQAEDPAPAPTENSINMEMIKATDFFESLGWYYGDAQGDGAGWTNTGTWDPSDASTTFVLNDATRKKALGGNATVAILDGRANESHDDLPYDADVDSTVFVFVSNSPFDPAYELIDLHGSHVSGIVGARLNGTGTAGVAPEAHLINYAMFGDNGWVGANERDVLDHAASFGATVANMSYGPTTAGDFSSATSLNAINAHKSSMVVVKAAGNENMPLANERISGRDRNPLTNLIIVGSVNSEGTRAWYSNTPGDASICNKRECFQMQDIFLMAPGGNAVYIYDENDEIIPRDPEDPAPVEFVTDGIWSTDERGGYYRISGTSMAAPHVAGAVALLHSQWPVLKSDPEVTRTILFDTATDLGDPSIYGQGLLNVNKAMGPLGALSFSLVNGGGDSGGSTDSGDGGGKGRGKPKKNQTWSLDATSMVVKHGFAALTETTATISVFDQYRRDFPVPLSSLVREGRSDLSNRLEAMVGVSMSWADQETYVPGRDDFHRAITIDDRDLRGEAPLNFMSDIKLASFDEIDMRFFAGSGNAQALYYTPGVLVGGMSSLSGTNTGINPFLALASGEHFAGASIDKVGPFRFAAGYSETEANERLLGAYKAGALAASVGFTLNESQTVNVSVTNLREVGGAFGSRSQGALSLGKETSTRAISLSWDHADWHGVVISASWTLGLSSGDTDGLLTLDDETLSDAFHFGVARAGIFDDRDRLAVSLSQPLRIASGSLHLYADKAYDENAVMQMQSETVSLTPSGRELDVQVEYRFSSSRLGGISAFAYHAMDAGHIAGHEESGAGMKYSVRF